MAKDAKEFVDQKCYRISGSPWAFAGDRGPPGHAHVWTADIAPADPRFLAGEFVVSSNGWVRLRRGTAETVYWSGGGESPQEFDARPFMDAGAVETVSPEAARALLAAMCCMGEEEQMRVFSVGPAGCVLGHGMAAEVAMRTYTMHAVGEDGQPQMVITGGELPPLLPASQRGEGAAAAGGGGGGGFVPLRHYRIRGSAWCFAAGKQDDGVAVVSLWTADIGPGDPRFLALEAQASGNGYLFLRRGERETLRWSSGGEEARELTMRAFERSGAGSETVEPEAARALLTAMCEASVAGQMQVLEVGPVGCVLGHGMRDLSMASYSLHAADEEGKPLMTVTSARLCTPVPKLPRAALAPVPALPPPAAAACGGGGADRFAFGSWVFESARGPDGTGALAAWSALAAPGEPDFRAVLLPCMGESAFVVRGGETLRVTEGAEEVPAGAAAPPASPWLAGHPAGAALASPRDASCSLRALLGGLPHGEGEGIAVVAVSRSAVTVRLSSLNLYFVMGGAEGQTKLRIERSARDVDVADEAA